MDKIIYQRARLRCDSHRAFEMFTVNGLLESWLTALAEVEPVVGGKYELFWDPGDKEINSTIGCKVTAIERDKFLCFEWKGPAQYQHFMNEADPLTHVVVFFMPREDDSVPSTEAHLIHSGWRGSAEWEEAREWFERAWGAAFKELENQVNL
ncbi:MAG: hypothetical protein CEE40_10040 [Chloroflexi bacterium B3_Chlor]|nr:MAG: hypothetical protein CEE40_10040 [Chloroflexi bacterium B3_Chlor]